MIGNTFFAINYWKHKKDKNIKQKCKCLLQGIIIIHTLSPILCSFKQISENEDDAFKIDTARASYPATAFHKVDVDLNR